MWNFVNSLQLATICWAWIMVQKPSRHLQICSAFRIFMWKNKFTSQKLYSLVLSSLKIQRGFIQTKYTTFFYSVWKGTSYLQTFKSSNYKELLLQCVYYCYDVFDKYFLFHVITVKHCFYGSFSIPWGLFNRHVLALFETSDFKEACILFFLYPQ